MKALFRTVSRMGVRSQAKIRFFSNADKSRFYKAGVGVDDSAQIKGVIVDTAADLKKARPGDIIEVPYELTVSTAFRDFWQSAFYSHDRINTSTPFARNLGLQDQPLPFSLMLFLAASMSHADEAKIQTGFSRGIYHWPAFAGDTFKKRFVIQKLRNTSDGNNSVVDIHCEISNQRDVLVFSCAKQMMFPFKVPSSSVEVDATQNSSASEEFLNHLIKMSETLHRMGSQTLVGLRPGQLILHTLARPLSLTHSMQLATLGRLTHERHFNTRLYRADELVVPGGLVLSLTTSLASRDLHEVLYEELLECTFPNETTPGDCLGAMSFVLSRDEHMSGEMEVVHVRTIGIKNIDVPKVLADKVLPNNLFISEIQKPRDLEEMLKKFCPELSRSVVCIADRKIYRQTPKQIPFLL